MADKELRRMNRTELIEIIYVLQQNEHSLRAEKEELQRQLDEKVLRLEKAGSIAEAALSLNHVFEDAQSAAAQYLNSLRTASDSAAQILEEALQKADEILSSAKEQIRRTEDECREMRERAAQDIKKQKEAFIRSVSLILEKHPELASHLREESDTS
ncbi:MAG: hypothetical protein LIO75_03885 [Lachnospiraceae bacterium]|nr:hypothetical protein [Lachnospiraceae bacterium]